MGGNEEEGISDEIKKKELELQNRERWEKIKKSKYNKWYERIKGKRISGYLKKKWAEKR